jgi:ABC-type hemin transport system substrate-binding protein
LGTTTRALTLARLENILAAAGLEAREERYESARQLASQFFSGLERAAGDVPADIREEVRAMLAYRDTTITVLSRGTATSADVLDRLLAQYHEVVRATEAAKSGALPRRPSSGSDQAGGRR